MVEGLQLASRTAVSLGRRLRTGVSYPGLRTLIEAFYRAVARDGASPVAPDHLSRVTSLFEQDTEILPFLAGMAEIIETERNDNAENENA